MTTPQWLERAASRSTLEEWTLGYTMEQYRTRRKLTHAELAEELGCTVDTLHQLSLCRRPEGPELAEHLATIAARFPVSARKLEALLLDSAD